MLDRETVIKSIEKHLDFDDACSECLYEKRLLKHGSCTNDMLADALALLKEQKERIETLESLRRIEQEGR